MRDVCSSFPYLVLNPFLADEGVDLRTAQVVCGLKHFKMALQMTEANCRKV